MQNNSKSFKNAKMHREREMSIIEEMPRTWKHNNMYIYMLRAYQHTSLLTKQHIFKLSPHFFHFSTLLYWQIYYMDLSQTNPVRGQSLDM
jgi:hypothetical protein